MDPPAGRRERKKAQTRDALADAALRLFLERGYDGVSLNDIADAADVSVTTLFKHFPGGKETLVFDQESDREASLVAAVQARAPGQSILGALRDFLAPHQKIKADHRPEFQRFLDLIQGTPALRAYSQKMWRRHEDALARAICAETGAPEGDIRARALARYAIEAVNLAQEYPDPTAALMEIFELLERGWSGAGARRRAPRS